MFLCIELFDSLMLRKRSLSTSVLTSYVVDAMWLSWRWLRLFPCVFDNLVCHFYMQMTDNCVIMYCNVPDNTVANTIARTLVQERLVACVNIIPSIQSIYWWDDKVQDEPEVMMVMKTVGSNTERVIERIKGLHPYKVPEIIFVPILAGNDAYMSWIRDNTSC